MRVGFSFIITALLLAHIDGASTECEPAQAAILEACLAEYVEHLFALCYGSHRAWQVGIGLLVARNDATHQRNDRVGVELIELSHGEMLGRR